MVKYQRSNTMQQEGGGNLTARSLIRSMVFLAVLILLCIPVLQSFQNNIPSNSSNTSSISALQTKIRRLEYQTNMMQARRSNHSILGPISLQSLRPDQFARFSDYNMTMRNPGSVSVYGISQSQVPGIAHPYMTYLGPVDGWSKTWSAELVNTMVQAARQRQDISCQDYPQSALQLYEALDRVQALDTSNLTRPWNILVAGSISPWVEAIVLGRAQEQENQEKPSANPNVLQLYQNRIVTTDYNEIKSESPMIQFVSMESLEKHPPEPLFDMIVSYSSIEHDGLGRYGDPINPEGDFCAMEEYSLMLREGGWILLGVPVAGDPNIGVVDSNLHRLYSAARLERLFQGFERAGEPITVPGLVDWQNQPVYLLRKGSIH